jgi:hypothetical protein
VGGKRGTNFGCLGYVSLGKCLKALGSCFHLYLGLLDSDVDFDELGKVEADGFVYFFVDPGFVPVA